MAEKQGQKVHVSDEKKRIVADFAKLCKDYKVIAAVDVENLPAPQLNNMRASLRQNGAVLIMTKRRLMHHALEESKKDGVMELKPYLKGMPALLFSNDNPFKLFKILKKSKSPAPIKAGQKAPKDIMVPAGPTGFAPGPIIGELGAIGIKAGIEGGKVSIKQDAKVAKEGDVISPKLAAILQRLAIMPMEIGLNLQAAFENGLILDKKTLDIDEDAFLGQIKSAASDSFLLTVAVAWPTKDNIQQLVSKAHVDAYCLADSKDIMTSETVKNVLSKANAQAEKLGSLVK